MEGTPKLLDHLYNEGRLRAINHLSGLAISNSEWGPAKHRSGSVEQESDTDSPEDRERPDDN